MVWQVSTAAASRLSQERRRAAGNSRQGAMQLDRHFSPIYLVAFWMQKHVALSFIPVLLPQIESKDARNLPSAIDVRRRTSPCSVPGRSRALDMVISNAGDLPPPPPESFGPSNETETKMVDELLKFEQQSIPLVESLPHPPVTAVKSDPSNPVAPTSPSATISEATSKDGGKLSPLSLWQGRTIVVGAAAIYGTNFAAIKLLDPVIPLAASAAIRFTLAAAVVTVAVAWNESKRRREQAGALALEPWRLGGEVGALYCVGYLCQAWGLHFVDASKSAFFNALAVIVVPLLDALLKKKGLGWTGVASILMAVGGVALLELGPTSSSAAVVASDVSSSSLSATDTTSWIHVGDLLCLSQAVFFGVGYWRLESASTKYPKESGPITAGQLLAIAAGSVAYWTATLGGSLPSWDQIARWLGDPFIASAVAWTGLISTALALWLETVALSVVSAAELTILMTSISLWGSLFAYLTIGEVMSSFGMLGGALILSGCVLTSLGKEEVAPKTPGSE